MYKIRQATFLDMKFFIEMAQKEGWDPGICDAEAFLEADNKGFFIGELDGEIISCISAVKYAEYGFIGFYIVKDGFRGQGFGLKIWQHALNYLGDINIGLDGVVDRIEDYKKFGFKLAHNNARYLGRLNIDEVNESNLIKAEMVDFDALCNYDKSHFGSKREAFLKKWISMDESFSVCYLEREEIKGFGVCRKTKNGFKIGPLFAEDTNIAETVFLYLISKIDNSNFYLDINEEYKPALELVNKYQMQKVFETRRMYTKSKPQAKWDEVFGITSFELG